MHGRDHLTLEITQEDNSLVLSIREEMDSISVSHSICKVPEKVLEDREEKYYPQLVSIGPFHHPLKPMEEQKWLYLNTLLGRTPDLDAVLDKCVKALQDLEGRARKCYGEKILIGSDEFVKMMLLDGCFVIELFLKYVNRGLRRRGDPCFRTKERFFRIRKDMVLLENQIPFFILQQLFHIVPIPNQCSGYSLTELALRFFGRMIPGDAEFLKDKFLALREDSFNHVLDLIFQFYLPNIHHSPRIITGEQKTFPGAKELQEESGIIFKKSIFTETLLDIRFSIGILEIPPLKLQDFTELLLTNLVALENCYRPLEKNVASYVLLMQQLVQSEADAKLLCRSGVLVHSFDKIEDKLPLFKDIPAEVKPGEFYYTLLCEQVNGHGNCRAKKRRVVWSNWRQKLRSNKNWRRKVKLICRRAPMGVVGIVLLILFLVFTFTGTLFSVLSFFQHHFRS